MFQSQPKFHPTPYYGIASYGQGLPEYNFQEEPLEAGPEFGAGVGGGIGPSCGGSLIFTSPAFNYSTPPSSGPSTFPSFPPSTNSPLNINHPHSLDQRGSHNRDDSSNNNANTTPYRPIKMDPSQDDLAAQEAAAREYEPQLKGPLVGDRTTIHAITEEYAKADPVYVQKTTALPLLYSDYRPIQGDGNCGWRAIGFGYFETLIRTGNKAQVDAELKRLMQLNDFIANVGGVEPFVFEDMVEETFLLLNKISDSIGNPRQALAVLVETFNDPSISNHIIYHLRLLASSWLKGHAEAYAPFMTSDMGLQGYCEAVLERHGVEIEHIGVMLLVSVLLEPVGFVLEVVYLDRSPGTQVNTYRFPDAANGQNPAALGPIIYLLYRPDHYDIIYAGPAPIQSDIQVNRATLSYRHEIMSTPGLDSFSATDLTTLSLIPGFGSPPPGLSGLPTPGACSPLDSYNTPSPQSPWIPAPFEDALVSQAPAPVTSTAPVPQPQPTTTSHPLRFAKYCQLPEYVENDTWREPTFQTPTFKNSHFNTAHYNNPHFQPEEYKPGSDDIEPPVRSGRKRGTA